MPDTALFIDVLAHIEIEQTSDHSRWDQGRWARAETSPEQLGLTYDQALEGEDEDMPVKFDTGIGCGTSFCFAGWACVLKGETIAWTIDHVGSEGLVYLSGYNLQNGSNIDVRARELLGVRDDNGLFHPANELSDLYRLAAEIISDGDGDIDLREQARADIEQQVQTRVTQLRAEDVDAKSGAHDWPLAEVIENA